MTKPLLLRGGRVIDPSQSMDGAADVLIVNGKIEAIGERVAESASSRDGLETMIANQYRRAQSARELPLYH